MIAIVDFDGAATRGVREALEGLGARAATVRSIDGIDRAQKVIVPDGPSFARMIRGIRDQGLVGILLHAVERNTPILGIGHGLQLLFDVSHEEGQHTGLGVVPGKVTRISTGGHPSVERLPLPHRGWNQVHWTNGCPLLAGMRSGEYFYFDHAHHAEPLDAGAVAGKTHHGIEFASVVQQRTLFGVQFLPEMSKKPGLQVLANFIEL